MGVGKRSPTGVVVDGDVGGKDERVRRVSAITESIMSSQYILCPKLNRNHRHRPIPTRRIQMCRPSHLGPFRLHCWERPVLGRGPGSGPLRGLVVRVCRQPLYPYCRQGTFCCLGWAGLEVCRPRKPVLD